MSILTRDEILREIRKKNLIISPFDKSAVGPASVNLTLGNEFRAFDSSTPIAVTEKVNLEKYTRSFRSTKPFALPPGGFVLGITKEKITLPPTLSAWLGGRTRFARLGLLIHITAAFVQPGCANRQVLELYNASPCELLITPGERICQMMFERCEGSAVYTGRYRKQMHV